MWFLGGLSSLWSPKVIGTLLEALWPSEIPSWVLLQPWTTWLRGETSFKSIILNGFFGIFWYCIKLLCQSSKFHFQEQFDLCPKFCYRFSIVDCSLLMCCPAYFTYLMVSQKRWEYWMPFLSHVWTMMDEWKSTRVERVHFDWDGNKSNIDLACPVGMVKVLEASYDL